LHTKGESVVYRVTLRTVPPQTDSSPSAARLPIPTKTQMQKEENRWKQEIKQKQDVFEKKNLESEIHPPSQTVTPKIPLEEQKQLPRPQEKEQAPIPLPIGELSPSDTDSNIKMEDNFPVHLSLSRPVEQNQDIIPAAGSGEGSGQGDPGSGGASRGGLGAGPGQRGFGWGPSGKGAGIGQGGPGSGGPGDGSGTVRGGSGGAGSGNYGTAVSHPSHAVNPKPIYPLEAREKGYRGEVLLRVEVLSNGQVGQIEVKKSSGYGILDQSALSAVNRWKFIPARKGGVAIPAWVYIPVKFELL
jgi:protein TonB